MADPVVHFEIPARDPDRLLKFYRDMFGWTINKMDGPMEYWMVNGSKDAGGIDGGIARQSGDTGHRLNYVAVASVDEYAEKAKTLGATVVDGPADIPDVGRFAVLLDPEGNPIGLFQGRGGG